MKALHLEKIGLAGSLVTLLCCLGFGPLLAVLGAVGAGFLVNDRILAPLLAMFLALGAAGLVLSFRQHQRWSALLLHLAGSILIVVFMFVLSFQILVWLGLLGIMAAVVSDFVLKRQYARECTASCPPLPQEENHG